LLDLAGIPIPAGVDQQSLISSPPRDYLYGEHGEGASAQRMIRHGRLKLIYYPVGNIFQLFDLERDPHETQDLGNVEAYEDDLAAMKDLLIENLLDSDFEWLQNDELVGLPDKPFTPAPPKHLMGQRGVRFY